MTEYRYPAAAVHGDLARAGIGVALCAAPLVAARMEPWAALTLSALVAVFVLFGARTWLRRGTRIAVDEQGIAASGVRAAQIAWGDLHRFKLSYFSTRRDRSNGWMQLNLRGKSGRISLDSSLDGFEEVCRRAYHAAAANGIELSPATQRNLVELGLSANLPRKSPAEGSTGWGNPADWRR